MAISNHQLIVDVQTLRETVRGQSQGRIRGRIWHKESVVQAFLADGETIGVWNRMGSHTLESLLPLSVTVNSEGAVTEALFEGRRIPSEQRHFVDMDEALASRQKSLVNMPQIQQVSVLIIGAGTVGSLAADNLVRMGVRRFILMDRDTVEATNLSRTCYGFPDIGRTKVQALADHLRRVHPQVQVETHAVDVRAISRQDWHRLHNQAAIALIAIDDVRAQVALSRQLSPHMPVVVAVLEAGGSGGEVTYVTSHTKPFCCVTNVQARLGAAPQGVSGAQGLVTDVAIVVAQAVNTMVHLLHDSHACRRFPQPLNPEESLLFVGRGDAGGPLQVNLHERGTLSSVYVNTSSKASPCPYCRKDN